MIRLCTCLTIPCVHNMTHAPSYEIDSQPDPVDSGGLVVSDLLKDIIDKRSKAGLAKYKVVLKTFDGRDTLVDALEEAVDLSKYLTKLLYERKSAIDTVLNVFKTHRSECCDSICHVIEQLGL